MPITAAPGNLTPSSGLHTYVTYTYPDIHIYTEEKYFKKKEELKNKRVMSQSRASFILLLETDLKTLT